MDLMDQAISPRFATDPNGRLLYCPFNRRRGYVVESKSDEVKIRSFEKISQFAFTALYIFGVSATIVLGTLQANLWPDDLIRYRRAHFAFSLSANGLIVFAIAFLVEGLPLLLLWRLYKQANLSFTSSLEEVPLPPKK
jgi:hypothetical protein